MAQFDVYPNPIESLRETHPWVVEIQSNLLKRPVALIGIPLAHLELGTSGVERLNPRLDIAGETCVLETLAIGSYDPGDLRGRIANLRDQADVIWDALDYALHGY